MKTILNIFVALAVVAAGNLAFWSKIGTVVDHSAKPVGREALRPVFEQYLERYKPDVVFMGNSMLTEGVDMDRFTEYTNTLTMRLARGGSESAWWYLVLKNVIVETPKKPKLVVVFFRDTFLTMPDYRVNGKYKVNLNDFCNEQEPVLDRLAYLKGADGLSYMVNKYVPLFRQREKIQNNIESFIKYKCAAKVLGTDTKGINTATAAVFDGNKMNHELMTARQLSVELESKENFQDALEKSFLPHIIDVAENNDIQLTFVRIKRRRDAVPDSQPEYLKRYITNLKQYLESRGTYLIDYTDNLNIKLEHFAEGDHLNKEKGAPVFTKMLAEDLKPIIDKHLK